MTNSEPIRAVIVDDEPLARDAVRTLVSAEPDVVIVGEASNGREAVDVIRAESPDLVFLDIQMPDLGGFAVLEALGTDIPAAVLFVTAHDDHALRAFEVHALDYVLKPFGRERMALAVERARRQLAGGRSLTPEAIAAAGRRSGTRGPVGTVEDVSGGEPEEARVPRRLGIRSGSRVTLVEVDSIDWIGADGDYVRLHIGERDHLLSARMNDLEATLAPGGFVRVHRSTLVNVARIREYERDPDGGGALVLSTGARLRVAESRWASFTEALGLEG